jgi:ADP-ribose pyrophosphatase YjhB (NUDIX family)
MDPKTHCPYCGGLLIRKQVEDRRRLYCSRCSRPIYENPIPATCLVVVDPDARLLLVQRSAPPKIGQWCLPGGFIEVDEMPESAALRELSEETNLHGKVEKLLGVRTSPSTFYQSVLLIGYLVREYSGQLVPGDDAADVRWFDPERLPTIPFDSHAFYIQRYFQMSACPHSKRGEAPPAGFKKS